MLSFTLRSASVLLTTVALAACAAPPAGMVGNGTCSTAIALEPGVRTRVEVGDPSSTRSGSSCSDPTSLVGANHYSMTIPPRSRADIFAEELPTSDGARRFYTIYSVAGCPATSCRFLLGNSPISSLGTASVYNNTDAPQTSFIVPISGVRNSDLALEVRYRPLADVACERAPQLTLGGERQLAEFVSSAAVPEACGLGLAAYFSVTVPPSTIARIAVINAVGPSSARLIDGCGSLDCGRSYQDSPSTLLAQNNTDAERRFIVEVVGARGASARVAYIDNVAPAAGCEWAQILAVGDSATANTASAMTTAACATAEQPQLFYTVSVAARSRATFALRRTGGGHARARLLRQCGSTECAAVAETVDDAATNFVIDNPTDTPVQRILAVSATGAPTEFSLAYLRTNELPTNTSCATVMALFPGQSVLVDTSLGGGAPVGCETSEGSARYYSVVLSPQRRATVTLTQMGGAAMRLRTYRDCAMGVCDGSVTTTPTTPATLDVRFEGAVMGGQLLSIGAVGGPASTGVAQLTVGPAMPL